MPYTSHREYLWVIGGIQGAYGGKVGTTLDRLKTWKRKAGDMA